jgi:diadenosine tetraphosphate (Ap4A) HIT family hydrolase
MSWKKAEQWQGLISGAACPMCADISLERNPHSILIEALDVSYLRLPLNQDIKGRVLVGLKRHAVELFDLSPEELSAYWNDVARAAKAVHAVFQPVKLYYGVFGGRCPHIHCHILPMYIDDDPNSSLALEQNQHYLQETEYKKIVLKIRGKL